MERNSPGALRAPGAFARNWNESCHGTRPLANFRGPRKGVGKDCFEKFASRFWNAKLERVLARGTSSGSVTVMAGVQAGAALADDEHGHYKADDYSSALSDEHFRL